MILIITLDQNVTKSLIMNLRPIVQLTISPGFELRIFKCGVEVLTQCTYSQTLVNSQKYSQYNQKLFLQWDILEGVYQKFSENFIFHGNCYEKQKEPGNSYHPLFRLPNMLRNTFYVVVHHLTILSYWSFGVFPKIKNSCKPFLDVMIIKSTFCWNHKTLNKKTINFYKFEFYKNMNSWYM